jgi:hypothetical protein
VPWIDRDRKIKDWIGGHSSAVLKCMPALRDLARLGARKEFLGPCLASKGLIPLRRNQQFFISKLYAEIELRSYVNGTGRFTLLRHDRRHDSYRWALPSALRAAEPGLSDAELSEWESALIAWAHSTSDSMTAAQA